MLLLMDQEQKRCTMWDANFEEADSFQKLNTQKAKRERKLFPMNCGVVCYQRFELAMVTSEVKIAVD